MPPVVFIFLLLGLSFNIQPELTGFIVQQPEIAEVVSEADSTVETIQQTAILGQPVKWTKTISLSNFSTAKVRLPIQATNISVNKITSYSETKQGVLQNGTSPSQEEPFVSETGAKFTITGAVTFEEEEIQGGFLVKLFRNLGRLTGGVIGVEPIELQEIEITDNATQYEIEYETPAPYAIEEPLKTGRGKRIKIVGPETIHYENVLAFTNLDENLNIRNPSQIKIRWVEEDSFISPTSVQDKDGNGIYDYIEWIAPSLSTQTFDIIVITKAEHLDSNRNFVSDIYEEVRALDDIWSEPISSGEYVRVTFEIPLDFSRDITIYPRTVSGTPRIEVYEFEGTELIAEFTTINDNEYNKVFLTNLKRSQDTFDLRISGGSLEFDHIVDPKQMFFEDCTDMSLQWSNTGWNSNGECRATNGNPDQTNAENFEEFRVPF